MRTHKFLVALTTFSVALIVSAIYSCNSNADDNKIAASKPLETSVTGSKESIPDSIVQFLILSASNDFRSHQPPTPIDFRKVKVGYVKTSTHEKTFVLCGEFLSEEKKNQKEWEKFATVKTSGYEQYIGNQALSFCEKATMVLTDETNLSTELKNKLLEASKPK